MRDFIKNTYLRFVQTEGKEKAIEEIERRGATQEEIDELTETINDDFLN